MAESPTVEALPEEQQRQLLAVGRLFATLAQDPTVRPKLLEAVKEVYPQVPIPELDVPRVVDQRVAERVRALDETLKPVTEKLNQIEGHLRRERWKAEHGLGDEEVVEIEKLAADHKIGDAKAALELWRARQAGGRPRTTSVLEGLAEEERKLLRTNPKEFAHRVGRRVLTELRTRQRSA
jgi:hypothetical protein